MPMQPSTRCWRLALIGALAAHAQAAVPFQSRIIEPRAFGHFIGDILVRRIEVDLADPYRLAPQGLPKLERADAWVELIDRRVSATEPRRGAMHYVIELTYQIVNSPVRTQLVSVPGGDLRWVGNGNAVEERLPDFNLMIGPLTGLDARLGLEERRPARAPLPIDGRRPTGLALLFGALGVFLGVAGCIGRWGLPLRRSSAPFAQACRSLRRLERSRADADRQQSALRTVHRAFDATAGRRVFGDGLDEFFAHHAEFAPLRPEVERFYAQSRAEFFGHGHGEEGLIGRLLRLCEQLRLREKLRRSTGVSAL